MTSWQEARAKLLAENATLREEYDRLGPRFETLSKLIDARERLHLSQSELARRMGLRANVISRLESAQHSPRLDTLIAYARALGLGLKLELVKQGNPANASRRGGPAAAAGRRPAGRDASTRRRVPAARDHARAAR